MRVSTQAVESIDISPKVKLPAYALGGVGALLVAASYLIDGLSDLREIGFTLLGASPLAGIIGYNAKPGGVTVEVPENVSAGPRR